MAWFKSVEASRTAPLDAGVLLVNLGTPAAPTYRAIRRFLGAFLGDRRVIEACPAYWYPLLHGLVLTTRPLRTRKLYEIVWTDDGSPLLARSQALALELQTALGSAVDIQVELAMTYGEPSIPAAIERLQRRGVRRLFILPMYPQYSSTTTGAVFDRVMAELSRWRYVPALSFVSDYHAEPAYIEALAASVRAAWASEGRSHLVLSNHGIPVKYEVAGDPYRSQLGATTAALVTTLGLKPDDYSECFQSRFGPTEWVTPYTDERLAELARAGVTTVTVLTPSFAVDCLETLEEIGIRSREAFIAAGGRKLLLIPPLNESPGHVAALSAVLRRAGL